MLRLPALAGAGVIGGSLAVDPGLWRDAQSFAFAWLRDGAPIPAAEAATYAPGPADDRAALACRVTAVGPGGARSATTAAITIAFPPPVAIGQIPDFVYTPDLESNLVNISSFFSGASLRFSVTGTGVSIDPESGVITFDFAAIPDGGVVTVAAANSGGRVELDLALRVAVLPVRISPPALSGEGRPGAPLTVDPGIWSGRPAPALALQWLADGAPIAGATETVFTPGPAQAGRAVACRVTATNAAGTVAAETPAIAIAHEAPRVVGALAPAVFARGSGPQAVAAAAVFAGQALVFSVEGAGATIDPATGVVTIPTATALAAASATVRATNSGGVAEARLAVTVLAAPAALAAPAPAAFAQEPGSRTIAAAALFSGDDLGFTLAAAPAGVTIDAAGVVTVPTAAALAGEIVVRAANVVGSATQRLALTVLAAPAALAAPAPVALAQEPGSRTIATAALFSGDDLGFTLAAAPAGVTIDAAGVVTVPTAAALAGEIVVRAANVVGSATQRIVATVLAAPTAPAAPAAATFLMGTGTRTISAQAFFAGEDLAYALDAAPAGVTINAGSGLVSVPTTAALTGEVVVRAVNAMGAATQRVAVRVRPARTVFDTAAALDEVRYNHLTLAPGWTLDAAGGFARLTAGRDDRAQGDWAHAGADGRGGDGRYRILARWGAGATSPTQARPFGLIGRMSGAGDDFRAVRVDVLLQSGVRSLHLREYAAAGGASRTLATVATAWTWDAWHWLEVEFEGRTLRARLYAEAETPTGWTSVVSATLVTPGAFGPTSFSVNGQSPAVDIRQIEFQPLAEAAPAAARAADWTAGQTSVQS